MNVDILLSTDGGLTFPITLVAGTPNDGSQAVVIPNVSGTTNRIMVKGTNHIFFDINNSDFTIIGSGLADTSAPTTTIISASGTTTSSTNLSWNVSSDNIGVTGYKVYQNGVLKATTTATSLVVSGLSAFTTYGFYVTAFDAAGNTSVASNTVNVTTLSLADTSAPTTTIISASGTTTSSTNLSWNVSSDNIGVTGYKVYQNGVLKATTTATSLVVSDLLASTTYGFYVTAYDAAGNTSVASNTVNVTTLAPMVSYCTSNGGTAFEFIKRVQIGTIDNVSGNNGGYGNFTSMYTDVTIGSLVSISISSGWVSASYAEAFNVWIDYNKNGSFETSELVYSKSKSKSATVSGSFIIPNSAMTGTTRMRVSMKYNLNPSACEVFTRGEVEDYTINILNGGLVKMSNESSESVNTEVIEIKDDTVLKTNKTEVEELSYKLYPNPVKDGEMYFSGLTYQSNYKIFNQFGQQLAQGKIENDMINVSSLASGIYFVQVATNSSVGVKRFIKE
jgi:chitodextrinase